MKKLHMWVFFLLGLNTFSWAQIDNFEFLNFTYSPASAAMGGIGSIFIHEPSLIYENPTALFGIQKQAGVTYSNHLLDISGAFAYYALPYKFPFMKNDGYLAFFLLDMNYGEVDGVDEFGNSLNQKFGANDFALGVSYSSILDEHLYYGANVKIAYSSIAGYSSSAFLIDFAVRYDVPVIERFSATLNVRNVGFFVTDYTSARQSVPFQMELGFVKKLAHLPLRFGVSLVDVMNGNQNNLRYSDRWKIGGEFQIHPRVALRLGYNKIINASLAGNSGSALTGFSFGAGIRIRKFRLDGSWVNWGDIGMVSQFGLNYTF
jgi:hypothetical protein